MSHKAFYQTFYQTEQLFRRADDVTSFPARPDLVADFDATRQPASTQSALDAAPVADVPTVLIVDPIVPVLSAEVSPAALEEEVFPSSPAEPEQAEADVPVLLPEAVALPTETPRTPTTLRPATPLVSQKVLILVDDDLLASELLFLEKILKAVHIDVDGIDVLNAQRTETINFSEVLAGKYIDHFFTFGVPFTRLNLDIMMDHYQPVRFDGVSFLMADSLPAIEADVVLKRKLWESLKKIFLWR